MKPGIIFIALVVTLLVIVLMQNIEVVMFKVLFWEVGVSRAVFFLVVFVIGFFVGFINATSTAKKKAHKYKQ